MKYSQKTFPILSNCVLYLSFSVVTILGSQFNNVYPKGIVINEIMAVNNSIATDEHGNYSDWIELYNASDDSINIIGWFLSDSKQNLNKFRIFSSNSNDMLLPPGGFLLLWLDGKPENSPFHTNFKLQASGEQITLSNATGNTIIDSITFGQQTGDVSIGRFPDGSTNWVRCSTATPSTPNSTPRPTEISPPDFSVPAGIYATPVMVSISSTIPSLKILYSTDGSTPNDSIKYHYNGPLSLNETTVLRTRCIDSTGNTSSVKTNTYIINEDLSLPVVSLVTDPSNLWDNDSGIYVDGNYAESTPPYYGANYHQDWVRPGNFEFFNHTTNLHEINNSIFLKISGGWSRAEPQKSFQIETNQINGKQSFASSFFSDKPAIYNLEKLLLRASSDNGWHIKNELIYKLNRIANSSVSIQSYLPVTVFLNGIYWGIYNLMETKGAEFINTNYGFEGITMVEGGWQIVAGSYEEHKSFIDFINNINSTTTYEDISQRIDVLNCIDYWFYEIYTGKHDNGNIRIWKPNGTDARWQWLSYDMDSWNNNNNIDRLTKYTNENNYMVIGQLVTNQKFKNLFITRLCDLLNSTFLPDTVEKCIDSICYQVKNEMPRHFDRWQYQTFCGWQNQASWLKQFAHYRPDSLFSQLSQRFLLESNVKVSINNNNTDGGTIQINTLHLNNISSWTGSYFPNIPVSLSAVPNPGYVFAGWNTFTTTDSNSISFLPTHDTLLSALFFPENVDPIPDSNTIDLQENTSPLIYNSIDRTSFKLPNQSTGELSVFSANGSIVYETTISSNSTCLTKLKSGVYMYTLNITLKANYNKAVFRGKFIVFSK